MKTVFTLPGSDRVIRKFKELDIVPMEADLTEDDPEIWKYLHENFNRSNIPVTLIYPADKERPPIILPELLTQGIVLNAIEAAR